MKIKIFNFIILVFISSILSFSDKVIMNDGRTIDCIIKREDPDKIIIDSFGVEISIPRSNIKNIEKLSQEESAMVRGDKFLEDKKYEDAIKAYQELMSIDSEKAKAKITNAQKLWIEDTEKQLSGISLDEAENKLREQLKNITQSSESFSSLEMVLLRILLKQAEAAHDKVDYEKSMKYLDEAWKLSSDNPRLTLDFVREIEKYKYAEERTVSILRSYVKKNPEDIEAIDLLVEHIWNKYPWEALSYVYLNNSLNPKATKKMTNLLPQLLLACFNSKPYPVNAPLDRVTCYERYLELNPNADKVPLLKARIEKEPENPQYLYDYALYLESQNQLNESIKLYNKIKGINPTFKDVVQKVASIQNAIWENEIKDKEVDVKKLESSFTRLANLTQSDFPPSSNVAELMRNAKSLSAVLQERPSRNYSEPLGNYLDALEKYRVSLATKQPPANQILKVSYDYKEQLEAERQKQLMAKRDEYIRRFIINGEPFQGDTTGASRTRVYTAASGKTTETICCNMIKVLSKEGKVIFHAKDIEIVNGNVVSATVLYIE